jgi:acetyl-CoA synthetase/medium-chain acyl-CoA synthetase
MYAKRSQAAIWFDCRPEDLVWCTAGTGWAKSLWNVLLGPWSCGSCIVVHEGGFVAEERMNLIRDLGVTVLCQAPTEYRIEAKLPDLGTRWLLPRLRRCVSAGEPLNPEVLARWREAFALTILDGYGQTENSLLVANVNGMDVRPGSMGKPTPGHDVAVVDPDGNVCEPGAVGDIALRGAPPTLFTGYYKNEAETNASRRGEWYLTGDRASLDGDGYFWFVGRSDDVISSGAYRIGPFEVESALLEHPAVAESAVVGSPDADRGNIVKAFVVLRPGIDGNEALVRELQEHCKRVTAPYKYPREIEFIGELPKTRSGKIRRVELRQAELLKKGATAASGFV